MSTLVPAVGYTRRSTDKQEASIKEQTAAIRQYADDKGYEIIRWYTDDAISGDNTENRHGFLQMLADAQQKQDYEAIICWDQKRFGRFDAIEAGYYIHPLRKAGVYLVLVNGGVIDWNESAGRIIHTVHQEGANKDLRDHSANVVRGQLEAAKKGSWLGLPPYGYRIEGEKKSKRLVIDSPGKARVVQRIFREFVEEGRSMADIARRLQQADIVPPGNGKVDPKTKQRRPWRYDSVRCILENPAYAGDYTSGRLSYGKYHAIRGGQIVKGSCNGGRRVGRKVARNPQSQWIVKRDTHEAIIDRETFEKAQALLTKGKTGRPRFTPETNPFALAGLLRCGKCGSPMWGDTVKGRRFYRCGTWQKHGEDVCEGTKVSEPEILEGVADHLDQWLFLEEINLDMAAAHGILKPSDLPEAFERIRAMVCPPARPKQDLKRLEKHAGELRAKIEKGKDNLLLLDAKYVPSAQEQLGKWEAELASVELELKESAPPTEKNINAVTLEVLRSLYSLASYCRELARPESGKGKRRGKAGQPVPEEEQALRRFFGHATHIVCHTAKTGTGTGTRHMFERGEIVFRGVGVTTGKVNLHNRVS